MFPMSVRLLLFMIVLVSVLLTSIFVVIVVLAIVLLGLRPLVVVLLLCSESLRIRLVCERLLVLIALTAACSIVLHLCLRVGQHIIRFCYCFELCLIDWLAISCIGMVLFCQIVELLLYFSVRG